MKTTSEILKREFNYTAIHTGLTVDGDLWQSDKWIITIDGCEPFDYSTGIGHRVALKNRSSKSDFNKLLHGNWKRNRENLEAVNMQLLECSKHVKPSLDDVLYSVVMDAQGACDIFADWCADYGFDVDSRKALATYEACQNQVLRLREMKIDINEASKAFSDY